MIKVVNVLVDSIAMRRRMRLALEIVVITSKTCRHRSGNRRCDCRMRHRMCGRRYRGKRGCCAH
jgi:hypothetical protein